MFWIDKKGCNISDLLTVAGCANESPFRGVRLVTAQRYGINVKIHPSAMLKFVKVFVFFDAWH